MHPTETTSPTPLVVPTEHSYPTNSSSNSQQLVPHNLHPVTMRAKNNIHKPLTKLNLTTLDSSHQPIEPTSVTKALKYSQWPATMSNEFNALLQNRNWILVPPHPSQNLIGCKWVFRIKRSPDDTVERYKARLVSKGFHQQKCIDYHETFSP